MIKFLMPFLVTVTVLSCSNPTEKLQENNNQLHVEAISLLGDTLYRPVLSASLAKDYNKKLEDTRLVYKADPEGVINIIWYGRRLAYVGRYQHAIEIYTRGLALHPESFQILRHRGHRFITLRQFDRAVADLSRAAVLATGSELEIEPDGIPNRLNQPLTTIQWNIYYHLGLAHYLNGNYEMAIEAFKPCLALSDNNDILVAVSDWMYMTYQHLGQNESADTLIAAISADWEMIENDSYFNRILMYQGEIEPTELLSVQPGVDQSLIIATQGYGLGNYYLTAGDTTRALEIFAEVLSGNNWAAFGYIAAEADSHRLTQKPVTL